MEINDSREKLMFLYFTTSGQRSEWEKFMTLPAPFSMHIVNKTGPRIEKKNMNKG